MPYTFPVSQAVVKQFIFIVLKRVYHLRVQGQPHLVQANQQTTGYLLAGNHTGWWDVPMVLFLWQHQKKPLYFFMAEKVLAWPVLGQLVALGNVIPVAQGKELAALKEAIARLKAGAVVCIFPEGKLTTNGELDVFQPGVGFLARKAGVPVLPFAIHGGFKAWGWGKKMPCLGRLRLQLAPPNSLQANEKDTDFANRLKQTISNLLQN